MPGKGGDSSGGKAAQKLASISEQLVSQTDPIRQALIARSMQFLGVPAPTVTTTGGVLSDRDIKRVSQQLQPGQFQSNWDWQRERATSEGDTLALALMDAGLKGGAQPPTTTTTYDFSNLQPNNFDISASPIYQPLEQQLNREFQQSKQNLLETLPQGGGLIEALSNADIARARGATDIGGQIVREELARAFSLATGQPLTVGTQGLTGAGTIQAQQQQAQAAQLAGAAQGLGLGAGAYFGSKGAGGAGAAGAGGAGKGAGAGAATAAAAACWVAEELYGPDIRTPALRHWVLTHDNWFTRLYRKHGMTWAHWVKRYRIARWIAHLIWGGLWRMAIR